MRSLSIYTAALLLTCPLVRAQEVDSRAAQIEAARTQKVQVQGLRPEKARDEAVSAVANKTKFLEHVNSAVGAVRLNPGVSGFHLKIGGLVSGAGFGAGPEFLHRGEETFFRAASAASVRRYQKYDLQFSLPSFAKDRLFLSLYGIHRDYPGINYYGPGPIADKHHRSNFRLEDTGLTGTFGVKPMRRLDLGSSLGYLFVNVGPGRDTRFVSAEKVFTPAEAPGIDRQANFLRPALFAQYDYRDNPAGARSGGNYIVEYSQYLDRSLELHDFRRLDVALQQYIPFFNKERIIVLRGRSALTFTDTGQRVPFYLQPTLGGSDDLRGYRTFRFYDDNLFVLNAEYQWSIFRGMNMALFADAGKVFPRWSEWSFDDVHRSYGFGLRFNRSDDVFLRIDVGFSNEGPRVWVRFGNIFNDSPVSIKGTL